MSETKSNVTREEMQELIYDLEYAEGFFRELETGHERRSVAHSLGRAKQILANLIATSGDEKVGGEDV